MVRELDFNNNYLSFRLNNKFIEKYKNKKPKFGFNGLGYAVYSRTYSRLICDKCGSLYIDEDKNNNLYCQSCNSKNIRNEKWFETVKRVVEGTYSIQKDWIISRGLGWSEEKGIRSAEKMYDLIFNMKFLPPGRGLWAMGTPIVHVKKMFAALNNCAFVSTSDMHKNPTKPFEFMMDMSMLGVGVGFDCFGENSIFINKPDEKRKRYFVIEDTREGWVDSVKVLLESYFLSNKPKVKFNYSEIRKYGKLIKGFGGRASGPDPLINLHEFIVKCLDKNIGKPITLRSISDIMNNIGVCVVAGNVRRCLPENTLIHTKNGLRKIQDINVGDIVYTSDGETEVTELVDQGVQDVMLFKTQLGTFECTEKHKIAVMDSPKSYIWKMAKDLKVDDRLVFVKNIMEGVETKLPDFKYIKPEKSTTCIDITIPDLDEDIAWLIGLFHGDGYVYVNEKQNGFNAYVSIGCDPDRPKIYEKVKQQFKRFGVNINTTTTNGAMNIRVQSKQLALYFSKFKTPHKSIDVPEFILNGKQNIRAAYLAGLFDADGSSLNRPTNLVVSIYPEFLKQVQSLYASIGIPSRRKLHRKAKGNWKDLYQLNLVGETSILSFEESVSRYSLKYINKSKANRSQDDYGFPSNWVKHLNYRGLWTPNSKQMTTAMYQKITGEEVKLIPIKVELISTKVRKTQTYDISVKDKQEFIAREGLLVHNTAQIMLGDYSNEEYVNLKNYKVNPDREIFGWTSNNSVLAKTGMDYSNITEKIAENGEPGLVWLENIKAYSRTDFKPDYKDIRASGVNPCITGDSIIQTSSGNKKVTDLIGKKFYAIVNGSKFESTIDGFWKTGNRKVYKITLNNGLSIRATENHKFSKVITTSKTKYHKWTELKDLNVGEKLMLQDGYIEEIASISYSGCEDVYDCTINDAHCFSANGIITHNCNEQSLESFELCCLVETFPTNHNSISEFEETLKYSYLYAKTVTLGETHWAETNRVLLRNRRIGNSMSGLAMFVSNRGLDELKKWCFRGYSTISKWDKIYSEWLAVPTSIKTTSIKPSGSVSLLAGVTPGMHYPIDKCYIRRMNIAKNSDLVKILSDAGYQYEESIYDSTCYSFSFPIKLNDNIRTQDQLTIWEQFAFAEFLQKYWADNQVSCTVSFDYDTEKDQIEKCLDYFQYKLKGISLLPRFNNSNKKAYKQMPYEGISIQRYEYLNSKIKDINSSKKIKEMSESERFCDGDSCKIL
jgi:intein/homing endonuclease